MGTFQLTQQSQQGVRGQACSVPSEIFFFFCPVRFLLLLLLSRFSRVRFCATHRRQPNSLPGPWDFPGKKTGVGCHFLLQCMKARSESEVSQSRLTLCDPMDCSLPDSSVHGIFQTRVLEWVAIGFSVRFMSPSYISWLSSWFCKETVKWKSSSSLEDDNWRETRKVSREVQSP